MARPGVNVIARAAPPTRSAPSDTGVWFVAGEAHKGPMNDPLLLRNMSEFERAFGPRVSYSVLYDSVETYFREGGNKVFVSRIVGPGATFDTNTFDDSGTDPSISVSAIGPGDSGLAVAIVAGGAADTFKIVVQDDDTDDVLEMSPDLGDPAAAVDWGENRSRYVTVAALGENRPAVVSAVTLTGGDDDRANITDTERVAALASQEKVLGPGQVSIPGATTTTLHGLILEHAFEVNRVALLDAPNVSSAAAVRTAAESVETGDEELTYGAMFAPWAVVPGLARGTTRTVPYSAVQAGLIARRDSETGNPNDPAAGDNGQARFVIGLSQPKWTDVEREDLNAAGVNVARVVYGGVRTYGYRSLSDDPAWLELSSVRTRMAIVNDCDAVGESFMFAQLDGQRRKIAEFGGALTGVLMGYYVLGALYGETADDAFIVDVGDAVNTPETIADRQLLALIGLRTSPFAEMITIEIVKVPVTENL